MIVTSQGSSFGLALWQWRTVTIFIISGIIAAGVDLLALAPKLILPAVPMAVMGGALGIFVSFRTNSSYDRWWEGRKLWERMINSSRHLATQILSYMRIPSSCFTTASHCPTSHA